MESKGSEIWRIRLFGGPTLEKPGQANSRVIRFRSAKVASLLSYLAIHHEKPCSREELMDALWPDEAEPSVLGNRFRVTLASLRKQIEPQGFPFGSVLDTSIPGCIALRKGATSCDFADVERHLVIGNLEEASNLMESPLLPGVSDDWASQHRLRFHLIREELTSTKKPSPVANLNPEMTQDRRHILPLYLTRFFGRERDIEVISELVAGSRLVTLTGPPGVGKTRLSIETLRDSRTRTVFVPISECRTYGEVCEKILQTLGVGSQNALDSEHQLIDVLRREENTRIILDNAEHISEEVARLVLNTLSQVEHLSFLVTSRQSLDISGERTYRIRPISKDHRDVNNALGLFFDRVKESRPDFVPNPAQEKLAQQICEILEGLPLAIELAAAQVSAQSIPEILNRIKSNQLELKSQKRTVASHHQSLRVAITSSLDALSPKTAKFLAQSSIFSGAFTVDQVGAICETAHPIEHLQELIERSLINPVFSDDGPTLYQSLTITRQAASERLSDQDHADLRKRHSDFFLKLCRAVDENRIESFRPLDGQQLNITAAFENGSRTSKHYWEASRGAILHAFVRGNHRTALPWIRDLSERVSECPDPDSLRDWIDSALQVLPDVGLFAESKKLIQTLRERSTETRDDVGLGIALISEGLVFSREGNQGAAEALHRQALEIAKRSNSASLIESALSHLVGTLNESGQFHEAIVHSEALLNTLDERSRRYPLAHLLAGVAHFKNESHDRSACHFRIAKNSAQEMSILSVEMYAAYFESQLAALRGDHQDQVVQFRRFQMLRRQTGIMLGADWDS